MNLADMSQFISLVETAAALPLADFATHELSEPLSCLVGPAENIVLTSYSRFNAPDIPIRRQVFSRQSYVCEPVYLFRVPNARFFGNPIFFTDATGRIIRESVPNLSNPTKTATEVLDAARARSRKKVRELMSLEALESDAPQTSGKYILAAGTYSRNYYHWHVDLLMAVALARDANILDEYKVILSNTTPFTLSSLAYFGVDPSRIMMLPEESPLQVEEILFSSTSRNVGFRMHPLVNRVFDVITAGIPKAARSATGRRLFVSRADSTRRLLQNRKELEAAFDAIGFEVIDPGLLSYDEQVAAFHAADVVVGEHGGGLGNIGFCKPGALVVELFNPRHHDLCYLGLAEIRDLSHQIYLGTPSPDASVNQEWSIDAVGAVRFVHNAIEAWRRNRERVYIPRIRGPVAGLAPTPIDDALG